MALAPDDTARGAVHSNLSLCKLKLEDAAGALEDANSATTARPTWEKGPFRAGEALFQMGRHEDAEKAYATASSLAPSDATIASRVAIAKEAQAGFYFRQLLPGRDICVNASNAAEQQIAMAATQMKNFVYLVGDAKTRECVVIDACWDVRGIQRVIDGDKMKLVGAIATHYHFDHTGGTPPPPFDALGIKVPGIRELHLRGLPCHAHEEDAGEIVRRNEIPRDKLITHKDGALFKVGAIEMKFMHTPGHSPGSMVIAVRGDQQGAPGDGNGVVISGDTIFPGSCGRLDLPDASAERMFDSLARCARELPEEMYVYPGHDYNGARRTVKREKQTGLLRPFTKQQWMTMHAR